MAESKGSLLAKSFQKHTGRAKEKLLQNLGKVDRTADEIFDEHLTNFNSQQISATRLQKEFNNYIRCIRAVQVTSKSLMDAICEVYEGQWTGSEALNAQSSAIEVLWQDFSHKLGDQVLIPLNTYTAQFPEMKKKIEKRNRKLIDYDSQRHSFQGVQANAAKRKDDVKITKGREQLEEARRTYELLNSELHDELPALFDSRILFLVTNLQTLFASEQVFHNETSKIFAELEAIVDKLATDSQRGSYTLKKVAGNSNPSSPPQSPIKSISNSMAPSINSYPIVTNGNGNGNGNSLDDSPASPPSSPSPTTVLPSTPPEKTSPQPIVKENHEIIDNKFDPSTSITATNKTVVVPYQNNVDETVINEPSYQNTAAIIKNDEKDENKTNSNLTTTNDNNVASTKITTTTTTTTENVNGNLNSKTTEVISPGTNNNGRMEQLYDIPVGATTTGLPLGVLYRVKVIYKYTKEDPDELEFDAGDIINVTEYDDPEDQEEGWLMGYKDHAPNEKGLFPANFTRPL